MACRIVISHRRSADCYLHCVLYNLLCADVVAHFSGGKRGVMVYILWVSKDIPIFGLAVLGTAGIARIKKWWHSRKHKD